MIAEGGRPSSPAARAGSGRRSRSGSPAKAPRKVAVGYLRNDRAAEETADELRALGAEPVLVRGNVGSAKVLEQVPALGPLDALVHNAATGVIRPALEVDERHWDWTLHANSRALLQLAQAAAPSMPRGSSIVAISSLGAQRVLENYVLVGTSKAALESLVRYLAVELAPRGIRVNAVSGGRRRDGRARPLPEPGADAGGGPQAHAGGPVVEPDDVAAAVAFLCSPDAEMVRGHDADRRRRLLAPRLSGAAPPL